MIYITGDTHGNYNEFMMRLKPLDLKDDDIVIVSGDFGFIWNNNQKAEYIKLLMQKDYNILFIDGNHEDFDLLNSYPIVEWNGGKAHKISDNIIHLMRGQIFTINDKTFFTMGGAYSIDKDLRIEGISWWNDELPCNDEYISASNNLEKHRFKVDYIITHTVPQSIIHRMGIAPYRQDAELVGYLEWVRENTKFNDWFCGHFHQNHSFDNIHLLYENVMMI